MAREGGGGRGKQRRELQMRNRKEEGKVEGGRIELIRSLNRSQFIKILFSDRYKLGR